MRNSSLDTLLRNAVEAAICPDPIMEAFRKAGDRVSAECANFDAIHAETQRAVSGFCEASATLRAQLGARLLGDPANEPEAAK